MDSQVQLEPIAMLIPGNDPALAGQSLLELVWYVHVSPGCRHVRSVRAGGGCKYKIEMVLTALGDPLINSDPLGAALIER